MSTHNADCAPVCPDCGDWAHDGPVDKCMVCGEDIPCSTPVVKADTTSEPVRIWHLECHE